ncbi:MAG: transcription elongation factor GreA [Actinomycetota bacterium]|jgi:transcription elongation factor GreA|nr:transcription elongation factor GreA [Actinomycetota bacterium]
MEETKKVALTQETYDRLKVDLEELEGPERQKIVEEIATARAHGDLSENAEYHAAKDRQGLSEARIREIRSMLENAEIIHSHDDGLVTPGKLVTLRVGGTEPETYLFGSREEKGSEHDVLTPESPIGQAIVGRSVGEQVAAKVPAGDLEIEIVEISSA